MPDEVPAWHHPLCIGCGTRHAKDTECPDGTQWCSLLLECAVCIHQWVGVFPFKPGEREFLPECPNCGHEGYVKLNPKKGTANGTQLETDG
jgi:hypothetical protein